MTAYIDTMVGSVPTTHGHLDPGHSQLTLDIIIQLNLVAWVSQEPGTRRSSSQNLTKERASPLAVFLQMASSRSFDVGRQVIFKPPSARKKAGAKVMGPQPYDSEGKSKAAKTPASRMRIRSWRE